MTEPVPDEPGEPGEPDEPDEPDEAASRGRRRLRRGELERAVRGSVILLTGASSGIGAASARRLGAAGATVALVARGHDALEHVAGEVTAAGGQASVHPCDLSDLDAVATLTAEVIERHGRVDVLVNNAGRSIRRGVDHSYDRIHDFQRTIELNYLGAVQLTLGVLPGMRERRHGQVVNISSIGVQAKVPRFAAYVASKAALDAFAACLEAEVLHDGVRITTVHMPLVRTPMIAPTRLYDLVPAISADRAAAMVCEAIARRPRQIGSTPGTLAALGSRVAPRTARRVRNVAYRVLPD